MMYVITCGKSISIVEPVNHRRPCGTPLKELNKKEVPAFPFMVSYRMILANEDTIQRHRGSV